MAYPTAEELAAWTLTTTAPGKWQLTDPSDSERVLYLYAGQQWGERVYHTGTSQQVGELLPRPIVDGMPDWMREKRLAPWERDEVDLILSAFRLAKRAEKARKAQATELRERLAA